MTGYSQSTERVFLKKKREITVRLSPKSSVREMACLGKKRQVSKMIDGYNRTRSTVSSKKKKLGKGMFRLYTSIKQWVG